MACRSAQRRALGRNILLLGFCFTIRATAAGALDRTDDVSRSRPDSAGTVSVSACVVEVDDPFSRRGTRLALLRRERSGALFESSGGDFQERSGIEFNPDSASVRLVNPLGGTWSINFLTDVANALNIGPFTELKTFTRNELMAVAARRICDIAYVRLDLYERFYERVDPWTGVTVDDVHVPLRRLDEATLARLETWRNPYAVSWSTAIRASDLSIGDVHNHSVRLGIASLLTTLDSWENFERIIAQIAQAEGLTPDAWAARHVSHFASLDRRFLFWECFAWYTSPYYVAGSLPREAEALLERMAHLDHLEGAERVGFWHEDVPIAVRLPAIRASLARARRSGSARMAGPRLPVAGFDVRYFLDAVKLEDQRVHQTGLH